MRRILWLACAVTCLRGEDFSYWIQACPAEIARESACKASDPELAQWALQAWRRAASASLEFPGATEDHARIRIYWASGKTRLYGEAHPIMVDGKRGAAIYVNPDISELGENIYTEAGKDPLLREAIVYLTCLHESGHALGLSHTGKFEDIMYSFGYGGDIPKYFHRYRQLLNDREDIRTHSGLSEYDRKRLLELFRTRASAALR